MIRIEQNRNQKNKIREIGDRDRERVYCPRRLLKIFFPFPFLIKKKKASKQKDEKTPQPSTFPFPKNHTRFSLSLNSIAFVISTAPQSSKRASSRFQKDAQLLLFAIPNPWEEVCHEIPRPRSFPLLALLRILEIR